jgi:hypothetical protein
MGQTPGVAQKCFFSPPKDLNPAVEVRCKDNPLSWGQPNRDEVPSPTVHVFQKTAMVGEGGSLKPGCRVRRAWSGSENWDSGRPHRDHDRTLTQ